MINTLQSKNYVKSLNNVMAELRNVRAMRSGVPPWGMGDLKVLYDTTVPLKYTGKYVKFERKTYKEIWLPKDEYAQVEHAMSTYAKQNNLKNVIETINYPYEPHGVYYVYTAVIDKNGTPIFVAKEILK